MANIIINNYCNQTCDYCFAWKNMDDPSLQKEMNLKTFLYCLQHLKAIGDDRVRILGGEPLIHSKIKQIFQLAVKGGFYMTIFSNFKISLKKLESILDFGDTFDYFRLKFNLNLNDKDFYQEVELDMIYKTLGFLTEKGCDVIVSYNIYEYSHKYDFIFEIAKKYGIKHVVLKVTNTVIGDEEIIDSNSKEYGNYIFEIIQKYSSEFDITFGCGLSRYCFTEEQVSYIQENTNIELKWGCENNGGKYDINTDGSIFRCYPLQSIYDPLVHLNISNSVFRDTTYNKLKTFIESQVPRKEYSLVEDGNCLGNQINRSSKSFH